MRCNAKNRNGEQCGNHAAPGTSKCKFHGGASLVGIASATFKSGRYSKDLPTRLAARYNEALADPKLLELRDEIALVGTRQSELLTHLDTGLSLQHWKDAQAAHSEVMAAIRAKDSVALQIALHALSQALDAGMGDYRVWEEIVEMTEQRRKLVESQWKYQIAAQQTITAEKALVLLAAVVDVIRRHVVDKEILALISNEIRSLTTVDADAH